MNRRWLLRALLTASAGSFHSGFNPTAQAGEEPEFTLRSDVRLVLLDVSVKDRRGRFVPDLVKDNFTIFEDGRPQQITVFGHDDLPVTVGILVDESYSMKPRRTDVLAAAEGFIQESNPQDEIFVLNFNDKVSSGLPEKIPFSSDPAQLRYALQRGVPEGKTALNDAVVTGLQHLHLGRREKKALVLISDGGDNASTHLRREVVSLVEDSPATIYTIGIYDEGDPDRDPGLLRQLASISGGEAYFPESAATLPAICRRIANDLRVRYTVGYVPHEEGGSALRHTKVRVSVPGARVLARSSYRYDEIQRDAPK
jgi:Ca-activated chloride channel homolog